ncbi:MAG TPA: hemolysin family protein [Streptosporangiaceae bacterium]|nr:hemolysin family protein [Streptosporangiaceae bacterium]
MAWLVAGALVLALLAGLCAGTEVALIRVSRAGTRELVRARDGRGAERLSAVLADAPVYLSVLLLIQICCETAATVLVTAALLHWLGTGWRTFLIAAAVMAALLYIVAGIGPRTLGRRHEGRLALAAAGVLYPVVRVLGPLPRLLLAVGSVLTPDRGGREGGLGSEEELRGLVDLLEQRRVIEPGESAMIHSVFELGETIVREVMVPRTDIIFVERGKTVRQALSLALRSGFSRIPVVGENEDDVIGIAYLKDLVEQSEKNRDSDTVGTVESVMRPATFVPESKPVDVLLRDMQARQIHLAIVIDEYGGTAGLVTIEDILEEIVGEITDEYDQDEPPVDWLAPGRARVTARLPVTDLEDLFGVRIEAEDVETVGGLLAHALGRVPIAGSVATVAGLTLTAESLEGRRNRIGTVTVERTRPVPADAPNGQCPPGGR